MKKNIIVFTSLLTVFLILMIPNASCVESNYNKKIGSKDHIVVSVKGGLGISIDIYGIDETIPINTVVSGAYSESYSKYYILQNRLYIHINIFKLLPGKINLNIYIGDQLWSYEATSTFFLFVKDIIPMV